MKEGVHGNPTGIPDLHDVLPELVLADRARRKAVILRKRGIQGLSIALSDGHENGPWYRSGGVIEEALLLQVRSKWPKHLEDAGNGAARTDLPPVLREVTLDKLVPRSLDPDNKYPILTATRTLQALVGSSNHAFSSLSFLCYYSVIREIYTASAPDWSTGGARAGYGGRSTAFTTADCIKAVLLFAEAHTNTAIFLRNVARFQERISSLRRMSYLVPRELIHTWVTKETERLSLACNTDVVNQIGTTTLALDPLAPEDFDEPERYLAGLPGRIADELSKFKLAFERAYSDIRRFRAIEKLEARQQKQTRRTVRTETAHQIAMHAVHMAIHEAEGALQDLETEPGQAPHAYLEKLSARFLRISGQIKKLLDPAGEYVRSVLDRELSAAAAERDAKVTWYPHELVFAATAVGSLTHWREDERLERAAQHLADTIDQRGRFPVLPPLQSTPGGSTVHPLNVEVVSALAQLLENTRLDISPTLVMRMFQAFDGTALPITSDVEVPETVSTPSATQPVLWFSENGPVPSKPAIWVSAIAIQCLDRLLEMLDRRINRAVLAHFSVRWPEDYRGRDLGLDDLVLSDFGLTVAPGTIRKEAQITDAVGIKLELMRAHLRRVELHSDLAQRYGAPCFSLLLHGPPGTGKTTLVTALAKSSRAPLVEISPSDIAQSGEEGIERRARDIFEALSMLTGTVVLFDEFEPILHKRELQVGERLSLFKLLTPGMLPKLTKLYGSARRRWSVFCLVTNHKEQLDPAAIRPGRFDDHALVLPPDPISRVGALLRGLIPLIEKEQLDESEVTRLLEVCAASGGEQVQALAMQWLFIPKRDLPKRGSGDGEGTPRMNRATKYVLQGDDGGWIAEELSHDGASGDPVEGTTTEDLEAFMKRWDRELRRTIARSGGSGDRVLRLIEHGPSGEPNGSS